MTFVRIITVISEDFFSVKIMFIYFYKLDIISILPKNGGHHYFIITLSKIFVLTFLILFCMPQRQPNFLASCIVLAMNDYQDFHY